MPEEERLLFRANDALARAAQKVLIVPLGNFLLSSHSKSAPDGKTAARYALNPHAKALKTTLQLCEQAAAWLPAPRAPAQRNPCVRHRPLRPVGGERCAQWTPSSDSARVPSAAAGGPAGSTVGGLGKRPISSLRDKPSSGCRSSAASPIPPSGRFDDESPVHNKTPRAKLAKLCCPIAHRSSALSTNHSLSSWKHKADGKASMQASYTKTNECCADDWPDIERKKKSGENRTTRVAKRDRPSLLLLLEKFFFCFLLAFDRVSLGHKDAAGLL